MKKIISIALMLMMLMPLCLAVHAEELNGLPVDPFDEFLDEMDDDIYAGAYINADGKKCITVVDEAAINRALTRSNKAVDAEDFIVEQVKYSMEDLKKAQEVLFDKHKELNITLVGLKPSINGLAVFMPEITEEGKQAVLSASPIPNIKFYANDEFGTPLAETEKVDADYDDVDSNMKANAISVKAGQYLKRNATNDYWSSVGYRAQIGNQTGFITCAHGWKKGNSAYLANGTKLGTITQYALSETADAAFVASNFGWYGLQDGTKAKGSGNAIEGDEIIFDGARHYQDGRDRENAKVIALNGSGTTDEEQPFTNAIIFNKPSLHGDSGAAVLVDMTGNSSKYKLVGFVRTMYPNDKDGKLTWGTACQWKYVRQALGCKFTNS